jgi:hypothetical protein
MKISKLIKPFIVLIWLLNINILVRSQSKQLIYEGASQGTEWSVYLLDKNRRLYLVNLEIDNSYSGNSQQTNLIQCSTAQPFVAFKDDRDRHMAIIHYINPGEEPYGYNSGSHWNYWAVCHNLFDAWKYNLNLKANQLGYSTKLNSEQIEIPSELLQYLK